MTVSDEVRIAVATALHVWCQQGWEQRIRYGSVALTVHSVDAHLFPEGRIESFLDALAAGGYRIKPTKKP